MHAKPGHPAHSALPIPSETIGTPAAPPDNVLSAAFGRALGGQATNPHLGRAIGPKGTTSAVKASTIGPRGKDRAVAVKPIAPRSGHR